MATHSTAWCEETQDGKRQFGVRLPQGDYTILTYEEAVALRDGLNDALCRFIDPKEFDPADPITPHYREGPPKPPATTVEDISDLMEAMITEDESDGTEILP